jgi:hypothetical protein
VLVQRLSRPLSALILGRNTLKDWGLLSQNRNKKGIGQRQREGSRLAIPIEKKDVSLTDALSPGLIIIGKLV